MKYNTKCSTFFFERIPKSIQSTTFQITSVDIIYECKKVHIFKYSFYICYYFFLYITFCPTSLSLYREKRNDRTSASRSHAAATIFATIPPSLLKRDIFIIIKRPTKPATESGRIAEYTVTSERQVSTHYNIATIIYRNLRRKIPSRGDFHKVTYKRLR